VQNEFVKECSTLTRQNYNKANWTMYQHLTSVPARKLKVEKDINEVIDDLSRCILQAAHKTIPRGARIINLIGTVN
jgi:hypothetical protein